MPFTKQGNFTDKVTNLPDKPTSSNYTATQIKTAIQQPSEDLKATLNKVVDDLNAPNWVDREKIVPGAVGVDELDPEIFNQPKTEFEVQSKFQSIDEQLADIAINVRTEGMVADGTTDNLAIFNTLKTNYPDNVLYFPVQGSNKTYYFSGSRPNLSGVKIKTAEGVIFKVDATPDLKEMQLLNDVIFENTVHGTSLEKHKNVNYEKVLTNIGSALHDIKNDEKYSVIDLTTWLNKIYVTSSGDTSMDGTATKTADKISWASSFTGSPQLIRPATLLDGSCYDINTNTLTAGVTVGMFMKTSTGEIIRLETTVGISGWKKKRITPPATISEDVDFSTPNGGAYGCVTGQEQNFSIYYKNNKQAYFMCADETLFVYNGEYGDLTEVAFIVMNSADSSSVSFNSAILIENYAYRRQKPLNIAIVGDSISYGAWDALPPEKILPIMLQNVNGIGKVNVTNHAISGRTSGNWAGDISTYDFTSFDYVLVMLGTNDLQGGVALSTYTSNLATIANKIVADGAIPVFQVFPIFTTATNSGVTGVTTSNYANHAIYTQALKKWCIQNGYEFGNARRNFGANLAWYGDNIHPTEEGQIAILKSWAEVLTRVLTK